MKKWLRIKLRKWLGIEQNTANIDYLCSEYYRIEQVLAHATLTAVDAHYKSNSTIVIASTLKGGNVQIIDAHFESLAQLHDWVKHAVPRHSRIIEDMPRPFR